MSAVLEVKIKSQVQGLPKLQSQFKATLDYVMSPCLKATKRSQKRARHIICGRNACLACRRP